MELHFNFKKITDFFFYLNDSQLIYKNEIFYFLRVSSKIQIHRKKLDIFRKRFTLYFNCIIGAYFQ